MPKAIRNSVLMLIKCKILRHLPHLLQSINVIEGGDASFSRRKLQLRTKLETVMAECESKIKTLQLYESKLKTIESGKSGFLIMLV